MAAVPRAASVKKRARAPTTLMAVEESPVLRSVNTVVAVRVGVVVAMEAVVWVRVVNWMTHQAHWQSV